jgi:PKD repeat protein
MDQYSQNFENLFRKHTEMLVERPSKKVLRKLRFRLWASDFFSFNFKRVNFVYSIALLGGILSGIFFLQNQDNKVESFTEKIRIISDNETPNRKEGIKKEIPLGGKENQTREVAPQNMPEALFEIEAIKGCAPLSVKFTDRSVRADSWKWDFGTGEYSVEKNPEYVYTKPGQYKATLKIKNKQGYEDAYSQIIEVLQSPQASFDIDKDNSEIATRKIIFKNRSEGATAYSWDFGDNKKSDIQNAVHLYDDYGVYNVRLVAKAANGCSDTAKLENKFIKLNYELSFPSSFMPNPYDRSNNGFYESAGNEAFIFYPKNFGVNEYRLTIYTLNGIQIFETTNIKQGWNGYIGGQLAPGGYYSYTASGIYPNGKSFEIHDKVKVIVENYY